MSHVSERGQITIDRAVRQQLGIRPGMVAYQRVVNGRLEVIFLPEAHHQSLYGVFRQEGESPRVVSPDDLEEAVTEAVTSELNSRGTAHG